MNKKSYLNEIDCQRHLNTYSFTNPDTQEQGPIGFKEKKSTEHLQRIAKVQKQEFSQIKSITYMILAIVSQLVTLVRAGPCGDVLSDTTTAFGNVVDFRIDANNTM